MSSLLVYRASAGSGKTFTLAVEYIKMLMADPTAYRHILAVTFTNKATEEMKERILCQLYGIATGDKGSDTYVEKVSEGTGLDPEEVRRRAQRVLTHILHDYSRFQVTTIDSFFQTVVRNLARELEIGASMNIELDTTSVMSSAVDGLIEELDTSSETFKHLLAYIKELIEEDKSWKITDALKSFGRHIFNEEFMEKRNELHKVLENPKAIGDYKQTLRKMRAVAEKGLKEGATKFFALLADAGVDATTDLKGGKNGIGSYFTKLQNGIYTDDRVCNKTLENCLYDLGSWRKKDSPAALTDALVEELQAVLQKTEEMRRSALRVINSCTLSLEHINKVGLLAAIDRKVHALNEENNRFLLAETNILLRKLIQDDDSSFVFEKIGSNIHHVMIDEFQDTSSLQWKNFRMLLVEALSWENSDSLIVGDVKQAIYRWRNGDWGILNNLRGKLNAAPIVPIGGTVHTDEQGNSYTATTNFRSEEHIVCFNNAFFKAAAEVLDSEYAAVNDGTFSGIYRDVAQDVPAGKAQGQGYVKVMFAGKSEELGYEETVLQQIVEEIERLVEAGVKPGNMAVLVRTNKFIPLIADYIEEKLPHIPVVSDEAYRLDASPALQTLTEALRCLAHSDDSITKEKLRLLTDDETLPSSWSDLPLYELFENLVRHYGLHEQAGQEAYLMSFFDAVTEYLRNNAGDPDSFLRHWDEHLSAKTIPAGTLDGVRLYSIHKSKGLEFHSVIIPFAQWEMQRDNDIWCAPEVEPYKTIPLLPVRFGKRMKDSIYEKDYLNEQKESWVDNLNILYVAFTRATANLIVIGQEKGRTFTVSELMQHTLPKVTPPSDSGLYYYDPEEQLLEWGAPLPSASRKGKKSTNLLLQEPDDLPVRFHSYGRTPEFKQSNSSVRFIQGDDGEDKQNLYLQQGRLLHYIFSAIRTREDVEPVMKRMELEGLFSSGLTIKAIRCIVTRALENRQAAVWFEPGWELFNECNIVSRQADGTATEVHRPDRVMMRKDRSEVIVVDFKFGTPRKEYAAQVAGYMQLLTRMGYPSVKGYLWYVYTGKMEEVNW